MEPRPDLASSGCVLASPGREYLALQPVPGTALSVAAEPGRYAVEWWNVDDRERCAGDPVTANESGVRLVPPFASAAPAVLYLRALPA